MRRYHHLGISPIPLLAFGVLKIEACGGRAYNYRMAKAAQLRTVAAEGPVTVAVHKMGREYHCTALEFDILGTGRTKQDALAQVQELVEEYIAGVIEELGKGNKVAFFNPSGERDWNQADELRRWRYGASAQT